MQQNTIQAVLQDALEEKVPTSQVDLWPAVKASLVSGVQSRKQGEKMNSSNMQRTRRLAFVAATLLILVTFPLITPRGRALAQNLWQLFTRAESASFPLQPDQMATREADLDASIAEVSVPLTSLGEAEMQVGFEAAELPSIPDGFNYLGARVYGNTISIEYEAQGGGSSLIITQSREGFYQSNWDRVPEDDIKPVQVGEAEGAYVEGTFVVYPGDSSATWNPDAPILRLRWMKEGIWFEMSKFGDVYGVEYLDRTGLIELAESMVLPP